MSGHETYEEMLARRAELTPLEESRLRRHLADCPGCRHTAEAYAEQTALLRSIRPVSPPPALRDRVLDRVRHQPPVPAPFWRRPVMGIVALAAALIVAVSGYAELHPFTASNRAAAGPTLNHSATPRIIQEGARGKAHAKSKMGPQRGHLSVARPHPRRARAASRHPAYAPAAPTQQIPASALNPPASNPGAAGAAQNPAPVPTPTPGPSAGFNAAIGPPPTASLSRVTAGGVSGKTTPPVHSRSIQAPKPARPVAPTPPRNTVPPTAPPLATAPPASASVPAPTPAPAPTGLPVVHAAPIRGSPTATPPPTPTATPATPAPVYFGPYGTATPTPTALTP